MVLRSQIRAPAVLLDQADRVFVPTQPHPLACTGLRNKSWEIREVLSSLLFSSLAHSERKHLRSGPLNLLPAFSHSW